MLIIPRINSRLLAITLFVLLAGGCTPSYKIPAEGPGVRAFRPPPPSEAALFEGGAAEWGLALSGGGIRSALFSIGVFKALYDAGELDRIDVISTVSGGGYANYWLYTRELDALRRMGHSHAGQFGDYTLRNDSFQVALCNLVKHGNFVTTHGAVLSALNPVNGPRTLYSRSIHRTFGQAEREDLRIGDLLPEIQERKLPYLIINARVHRPKASTGWDKGLYEFTPLLHGNEYRDYRAWGDESLPYRRLVTISGAAVRPLLKQTVALPGGRLTMADGGHSENLATVALIRRRVKNIIIVDGEQDGRYNFEGYRILQDRLRSWGYNFKVDSLDAFLHGPRLNGRRQLHSGVYEGTVRSEHSDDDYVGRIIYVKLSRPGSLEPWTSDSALTDRGKTLHAGRYGLEPTIRDFECSTVANEDFDLSAWFAFLVKSYSDDYPEKYPHWSTLNQSFYIDQSAGVIGLGYLIARHELVSRLAPTRP